MSSVSKTDNITSLPDIKGNQNKPYGGAIASEADITRSINTYIDNIVKSGRPGPKAGSLLNFLKLVQNAIKSRQASECVKEDKRLLVMADDPPSEKEVDTEAITFYLGNRESGAMSRTAGADRSVIREHVHHFRSVQQHPDHLGEKLVTMGRYFDNVVVFNIYAKTDKQALKRLLWFEDLMSSFMWYFKAYGIRVIELNASRVGKESIGQLSLAKYSVSFFVRTEDTYQFGQQELRHVALNIDISTNNDNEEG